MLYNSSALTGLVVLLLATIALSSATDPDQLLYARFGGWYGGKLASMDVDGSQFRYFSSGQPTSYGMGYCDGWMWGASPVNGTGLYQPVKIRVDDGTIFSVGAPTTGTTVACDSQSGRVYMLGMEGIYSMKTDGSDPQTFHLFPQPYDWRYESMRYFIMRDGVAYYRVEGPGIFASVNNQSTHLYGPDLYVGGLDVVDGVLYFCNQTTIMRASAVDGSGLEILSNANSDLRGLVVFKGKIIVGTGAHVYSFNLDGTNKTQILTANSLNIFTYEYQGSSSSGGGSQPHSGASGLSSWLVDLLHLVL